MRAVIFCAGQVTADDWAAARPRPDDLIIGADRGTSGPWPWG